MHIVPPALHKQKHTTQVFTVETSWTALHQSSQAEPHAELSSEEPIA